jgi:signal transduction histidine kinase/ligand-binding sensor domain-containing protein/DNA-binding response OmpR family regulator
MHRTQFNIIFISIAVMIGAIASAQTRKFFSPDNGLSNSLVNQVYQDRRGFIWIATEYGLNKFDGLRFTIYRNISDDGATGIVHNHFKTMFEDSAGNLLVGTANGLLKYNEEADSFDEQRMFRDGKQVYPYVTSIIQIAGGDLWLATSGQGIFVCKVNSSDFHAEEKVTCTLGSIYLNALCEDANSNIWVSSENEGINCYHTKENTADIFRAPDIGGNTISAIEKDRDGNIYIGTLTQGLYRFDPAGRAFIHIPHRDNISICIKSLKFDSRNRLHIGTDGQGLMIYNPRSERIENYEITSTPFDFSKGKVHSILFDNNHNLWLGFYQKGIILVPVIESRFDYYGYRSISGNPIGSCTVTSILGDREGTLWIGTDNDGIYGLNAKGQRVAHYHRTSSPNSAPDVVHSIHEADGNLWLASYMNGLSRLNPKTGYCRYLPAFNDIKVLSVTADKRDNLLVGTYGYGFYLLDRDGREIAHYQSSKLEKDVPDRDELPNDWVNHIICDRDSLVWIAHHKGLSCFDPVRKTFLATGRNNLLPAHVVRVLMEDSNGKIWIGSSTGLYCYDKSGGTMASYTTADGLPNEVICGICEDSRGNIWISSFDGICKLDTGNRFTAYYADDGLQGNEFSHGAMFRDKNGKIYFGGINGVTGFNASDIIEQRSQPRILLTNFLLLNRPVRKGDLSGKHPIVDTSILDAEHFSLAHSDNTFTLELSTLDFQRPERISYQYIMQGVNSQWTTTAPGNNLITYNNLDPGEYIFNVKATISGMDSPVKTIRITIAPPWYKTWQAYCLYWLAIILICYAAVTTLVARIRYKEELMEKNHAEKISQAKLQFFTNISHEIRTPLTLIINPLEQLINKDPDAARQPAYRIIHRNAQRILRLINQMMDMRKLDEGKISLKYAQTDLVPFIQDLMNTFQYQAETKNISFHFHHETDQLNAVIDPNNFDKVLMNILSNAFKFTPDKGAITVTLSQPDDLHAQITVADTGIGIDPDKTEKIFEPFYQIENNRTPLHAGTGIGLHLSRSLVELHHGSITAQSLEQGAQFIIRIPLGSNIPVAEVKPTLPPAPPLPPDHVPAQAAPVQRAKTKYHILAVDDEEEILQYLNRELSPDYHVHTARNGKDALSHILREKPSLVITDVMMPEVDGITLSRKIKQNININHIPVILLTAKTSDEDQLHGLEIGADAYFSKPFNISLLRQTIANLLARNEQLMNKYTGRELQQDKLQPVQLKSSDEVLIEKLMKYIQDNLANPKLNNEMIAEHVGISRVHLFRKLRTLTNQSPSQFIRNIRLRQAAALLDAKKINISEVAYATGFTSLAQFSHTFSTFYGLTPTEYSRRKDSPQSTNP